MAMYTLLAALLLHARVGAASGGAQKSRLQPEPLTIGPRAPPFPPLFVPDLEGSMPEAVESLIDTQARTRPPVAHLVVEFYAPWCPHCQQFAQTMERLGHACNDPGRPTSVLVARVNCVAERNLCKAYGIRGFPTLLVGGPDDFGETRAHSRGVIDLPSNVKRTAEGLVEWFTTEWGLPAIALAPAEEFNSNLSDHLVDQGEAAAAEQHGAEGGGRARVRPWDVQLALAAMVQTMLEQLHQRLSTADRATSTKDKQQAQLQYDTAWAAADAFAQLLTRLPSRYRVCDDSIGVLREHIASVRYPEVGEGISGSNPDQGRTLPEHFLRRWKLCSRPIADFEKAPWGQCAGTFHFQRGFPCGIWLVFHTLTIGLAEHDKSLQPQQTSAAQVAGVDQVAVDDAATEEQGEEEDGPVNAQVGMQALSGFVLNFFQCQGCRQHWQQMAPSIQGEVTDGRSAVLWLWAAHNQVTARILKEQLAAGAAGANPFKYDVAAPKQPWPPAGPRCPAATVAAAGAVPSSSSKLTSIQLRGDTTPTAAAAVCAGAETEDEAVLVAMRVFFLEFTGEVETARVAAAPAQAAPSAQGATATGGERKKKKSLLHSFGP